MIELTEWFANASLPARPWLLLGKGPTFDRRDRFDITAYNRLSLNHVVNEVDVDVAHIIDVDVVGACAEGLRNRCRWLLMPRHPHLRSTLCDRSLEDWFGEYPVLDELDREGRLVWYNLSGTPVHGRSPVIGAKRFSAEAAINLLGVLGVRQVRSLGIDGGRAYSAPFQHLADETMLANGANSFDDQFERLAVIVAEHGIDYQPLVEPLRIFVGTDESQMVAHRVLEYSIRKSASIPVEVTPMLDWPHPLPRDSENKPRTTFSFCRFMIPERCGYRGRALYLDADMVAFGDVAELADLPFDDHTVLCSAPPPTGSWDGRGSTYLGPRSVAVMLLDCARLPWKVDEIVAGLDEHRYTYSELLSDVCVVAPGEVADTIPPEWNELERFEPGRTKLLHYTVVPTQPWKNDDNPLAELWMGWYREAVEAGAVPPRGGRGSPAGGPRQAVARRRTTVGSVAASGPHRRLARPGVSPASGCRPGSPPGEDGRVVAVEDRELDRADGPPAAGPGPQGPLPPDPAVTDQAPSPTTVGGPSTVVPQRPLLVIERGSTPLGQYLRDLLHYGDLIRVMALRDLKLRYRQTALGAIWVVVQPVLSAAILGFVFGRVAKLSTDGIPIFLFAYAGMVSWNAFNQTVTRTTTSLLANAALVSKIFFPRLILPLASTAGVVIDFVISLVVLVGILVADGRAPGVAVLLLPVWLALLLLCSLGLGTLAASLSVRYRDLAQITPVLLQLLLYASPVAYAVSAVPDRYLTLYYLNPLVALLEGFRWSLLGTSLPAASRLIPSVLVSVALFVVGMVTLEKKERGFADVI